VSVEIPKCAIAFGSVTPPQGDVIDLRVHLGCTKEVSSFEVLLQNWDKKYSPGGTYPITVGMDGSIFIGRGTNVPQIITLRVESIKCESTPNENYLRVSGRCWGEKLFRRVVTKTYDNKKGEEIVKDLLDYYVGLSHVRDSTELVEDTDTTYTHLEYENTPVWGIIKYIAESSDLAGVIGYDFRVAPDGKFEFFPKNSKTSPVSLSEKIEESEYRKDILRIRNRIKVYGCQGKNFPANLDLWSESLDGWTAISGTISLESGRQREGSYCLRVDAGAGVDINIYRTFDALCKPQTYVMWDWMPGNLGGHPAYVRLWAPDSSNYFQAEIRSLLENNCILRWGLTSLALGPNQMYDPNHNPNGVWTKVGDPQWSQISGLQLIIVSDPSVSNYHMFDGDFGFLNGAFTATFEDSGSQSLYGLRELTETDEELTSDKACELRAKSLLDYLKDPAEYLTVSSTVIDYGNTPLLSGDKIHITLPNENVNSDYRIESVEYHVDAKTQTLEITLELGKEPPQLADYLYGLRPTTVTVEKLARTKLGKGTYPIFGGGVGGGGGGLASHHASHEAGDDNGVQWNPDIGGWDKITGWVCPKHIGPLNDAAAIINFRTKNKAGTAVLDHQFNPSDDGHGVFGNETKRWKEVHTLYLLLYTDGYMRIKTVGEANPKAQLSADMLQFGSGGDAALDAWLKRVGAGQLELKSELLPVSDNSGKIGSDTKRFANIYGYQYGISGNMLPASDNGSNLGASDKRFAHIYAVEIAVSNMLFNFNLIPDADNTYDLGSSLKKWKDLYLSGAIKALDAGVAVHLLPNASATYDLGSGTLKWGNLYVNGVGDLGWLNVGGFTVITNGRVLQNVTAAAGIITSGQFPLARMPRGDAGKYIRGYGADYDPIYASIPEGDLPHTYANLLTLNGGLTMGAGLNMNAAAITYVNGITFYGSSLNMNACPITNVSSLSCNTMNIATSCNKQYTHPSSKQCSHAHSEHTNIGPNDHHAQVHNHAGEALSPDSIAVNTLSVAVSVNCQNWVHADILFNNEFRITEAEKVNMGKGLVFLNPKGKAIMLIDGNGNVEIFGKLKQQASKLKSLWRKMKRNAKKVIKS
jgi:hypothetical protein